MTQPPSASDAQNPLLVDWTGDFGLPPFGTLTPEHFRPAFDKSLATHRAELDAIAADPAPATFDNTIVALEQSGRDLDKVASVFFVKAGADTGDDIEAIAADDEADVPALKGWRREIFGEKALALKPKYPLILANAQAIKLRLEQAD